MRKIAVRLGILFLAAIFALIAAADALNAQTAPPQWNPWTTVNSRPVPSAKAQATARQYFSRLFRLKYGQLDSNHSYEFMDYLFNKYSNNNKHVTKAYVAMTLCWQLAARQGNASMIPPPIQALCRNYKVDRWKLLAMAARLALPNLQDRWSGQFLMKECYRWGRKAIKAHAFAEARVLFSVSYHCARTVQNAWYLQVIPPRSRQLAILQAAYNQHLKDQHRSRQHPHDAQTLARIALYDWLMSLQPHAIAHGNAAATACGYNSLAEIVKLSGLNSPDAIADIQLGNLWWNLDKTHHIRAFAPLVRLHAVAIYRQAIPQIQTDFTHLLGEDQYPRAIAFLTAARHAVKRIGDPALQNLSDECKALLARTRLMHQRYAAAMKALAKNRADPAANQVVGEYTCFLGGQWRTGLPYLMHGVEPGLRGTAKLDLSNPHRPARQIALGNKWWTLARDYRGQMKRNIRRRAVYWYKRALKHPPATGYKTASSRVAGFQSSH